MNTIMLHILSEMPLNVYMFMFHSREYEYHILTVVFDPANVSMSH